MGDKCSEAEIEYYMLIGFLLGKGWSRWLVVLDAAKGYVQKGREEMMACLWAYQWATDLECNYLKTASQILDEWERIRPERVWEAKESERTRLRGTGIRG